MKSATKMASTSAHTKKPPSARPRGPQAITAAGLAKATAFRVNPGDYHVIDGDTIGLSNGSGIRFRFRSIACPEKHKLNFIERGLRDQGYKVTDETPGGYSTSQLRRFTDKRQILVLPSGQLDKYGRVLADIAVFPRKGAFDYEAISLERVMIARGAAMKFRAEPLPDLYPLALKNPAQLAGISL